MTLDLSQLCDTSVLAGAAAGAITMSRLIEATRLSPAEDIVFLDFRRIEVATSSFLRECLIGFRDSVRRGPKVLYPVAANLKPVVEEEFHNLLIAMNEAHVSCRLNARAVPSEARILGRLDDKQILTLREVQARGEVDASMLAAQGEKVGTTAWNNRLASLAAKGILKTRQIGRAKRFTLVLRELSYGT